jgi:stage II sporulation protein D
VEPILRVALGLRASQTVIGGQGDVLVAANGQPVLRVPAGHTMSLRTDGTVLLADDGAEGRYERLSFASLAPAALLTVDGRAYRGTLEAFVRRGGITVVNQVPVEAYVAGVVNAEMGRRAANERAALEAQAIVSRTYALKNRGRFVAEGYDVEAGVADQAYGGVAAETDLGRAAVRATAGVVLTWHGDLITPFFHSTCGGRTADPTEAFVSVARVPYLRSIRDVRPDGSAWCDISPRFRWTVEWEASQLQDILERTLPGVLGIDPASVTQVRDVYVRRRGSSGRATEVRVQVAGGEIPVPAHAIRTVFQTPEGRALGGSAVEFEAQRSGDRLTGLVARGRGWGHGVGMCQWGAVGRARGGQDYRTILKAYFPGTTLARWY